jgi:ABC-type multidrug transport system ATPase subunit
VGHAVQLEPPALGAIRASEPAILRAQKLTKTWRRGQPVLDGVDLVLPRGALVGLQGANGAGKTTLLRILGGLFLPDSGSVDLDGLDPVRQRRAYQRRLGFLAAGNGGLYARMSVRGHLDYWARLSLLPKGERRVAVIKALGRFELMAIAGNRVDRLSTGQRQRVRLAIAFLHDPDVILMDEPTNSLDDAGLGRLHSVLDECKRAGKTVLWCAPRVDASVAPFDAVYELNEGRLAST